MQIYSLKVSNDAKKVIRHNFQHWGMIQYESEGPGIGGNTVLSLTGYRGLTLVSTVT